MSTFCMSLQKATACYFAIYCSQKIIVGKNFTSLISASFNFCRCGPFECAYMFEIILIICWRKYFTYLIFVVGSGRRKFYSKNFLIIQYAYKHTSANNLLTVLDKVSAKIFFGYFWCVLQLFQNIKSLITINWVVPFVSDSEVLNYMQLNVTSTSRVHFRSQWAKLIFRFVSFSDLSHWVSINASIAVHRYNFTRLRINDNHRWTFCT